jgi:hypothetical protein
MKTAQGQPRSKGKDQMKKSHFEIILSFGSRVGIS